MITKINLHLIYIHWNRDGSLKNENDFDKTYYYKQKENKQLKVYIWTIQKIKKFMYKKQPFKIMEKIMEKC